MSATLHIGWWLLPLAITLAGWAWAIPVRKDEQPDGSMFSGMGYAIGGSIRIMGATIIGLLAWLAWAVLS